MVEFLKSKQTTFRNKPVGVVSADTGAVQLGNAVAEFGNSMQKIFWEEAKKDENKDDVKRAKTLAVADNGKLVFEKANFTQVGTPYAEKVLAERYSNAIAIMAKQEFGKLQAENQYDQDAFDLASNQYIEGHIKSFKDNGMDQYIPDFITKITNQRVLHSNKILNDTIARDERVAAQNTLLTVEDNINNLIGLTYARDNLEFSEVEGPETLAEMQKGIDETVLDITNKINSLVQDGHIKAPKAADLESELRRSLALGTIRQVVDKLGENGTAIKGIEQLMQSRRPSQKLIDTIIDISNGSVKLSDLQKVYDLKEQLNLSRTDMGIITREISNRSGDADKLATALGDEYTTNSYANILNGSQPFNGILNNTQKVRDGLNGGLSKNLGTTVDSFSLLTMPKEQYDMALRMVRGQPVVPTSMHDLFKIPDVTTLTALSGATRQQKTQYLSRVLDMWKNVAYTKDGRAKLQGYNDEYFKFNAIDAVARANGGDIVDAFNYFSRIPANEKDLNENIKLVVQEFIPDGVTTSVDKSLESILAKTEVKQQHWNQMKPYVTKLLVFKRLKGGTDEKMAEFNLENVVDVINGTYDNLYIEDDTIYDVQNIGLKDQRTRFSPQRKYIDGNYDKFKLYVNNMVAETSDVQGILGDEYFLLPDYRNSQFGDQAYTIVNANGIPLLNNEGVEMYFNTKEFDQQLRYDAEETRKRSLQQVYNSRLKRLNAKVPPPDLQLYKPNVQNLNFSDFIGNSKVDPTYNTTFKSIKNLDEPIVTGEYDLGSQNFKSKSQQEFVDYDKFGVAQQQGSENRVLDVLQKGSLKEDGTRDKSFSEYVDGLGESYLEQKIKGKGFENPSWQILTRAETLREGITDTVRDIKTALLTPDVAVEIQDGLIDIINYTSEKENFRVAPYVDADTLSIGRGFNIRYLTDSDYEKMPNELETALRPLQSWLNSNPNATKAQLVEKMNDFKREMGLGGIQGMVQQVADLIYTDKIKDIYEKYNEEFENFSTLAVDRQKALIDFSYQFGHERLKDPERGFPKYYAAITKAINTDDQDLRAYYFRQAGFHQAYNVAEFGNEKTLIHNQTRNRVGDRVSLLGFHVRDGSNFMTEDIS